MKTQNNNPYYVGVSRSGSHWIRLVLEGYLDGKSPISSFIACKDDINVLHSRLNDFKGTHDMQLDFIYENVIYLYRNPIDCIFSNLKYDGTEITNKNEVDRYLNIWIAHIQKWVYDEKFTKNKVILCYEKLRNYFVDEFSKLLSFLNIEINADKIVESNETYTKSKIREIVHDKKVINNEYDYEIQRKRFIELFGEYIISKLPETHKTICEFPKLK
jgi:hypothetical protein